MYFEHVQNVHFMFSIFCKTFPLFFHFYFFNINIMKSTLDQIYEADIFRGNDDEKQTLIEQLNKTYQTMDLKKSIRLAAILDSPQSLLMFYQNICALNNPQKECEFVAALQTLLTSFTGSQMFFSAVSTIINMNSAKIIKRQEEEIKKLKAQNKALDPKNSRPSDFEPNVHKAAEKGKLSSVQYHLEKLKVKKDLQDKETYGTILHYACRGGSLEVVKYLIENQKVPNEPIDFINGATPLHWACSTGSLPVVQYLLENKLATPDKTDGSKATALFYACDSGVLSVVKLLVENYGLSISTKDSLGKQPIHNAAKSGSVSVVEYLIGKGANKDCVDNQNWTPLHYACNFGKIDVVKYLVEHGANKNISDNIGRSPLRLADYANHPDIAQYLRSKGAA